MNNEKKFQNWIIFTAYAESLSLAIHLLKEGKNVIFAQIDDLKSIGVDKPEDIDTKKRRIQPGDGIVDKVIAEDYIKKMAKFENKDDYFVIFDFNSLYPLAEKVVKMGFTNGLFPTKFDYKLENDRQFAKEFVQSYYPDLKVAEVEEFKTVEEAVEMLENSEEFWALKGNDISCQTVVPITTDLEFAKEEIIDALHMHKSDYEKQGFILERQIRDGIEFCPQAIFYNGSPVAYSVDVENKAIGGGNIGIKCGCMMNVVISMPSDAKIIGAAFPAVTTKLAAKHTGLYYIDANLILKDGELYYLEFCSQRMGYDAIQTECEMAGGVSNYFEALCNGQNPYQHKYGVAVRGINMHRDHEGNVKGDICMRWNPEMEHHIWFYDCHKDIETGKYANSGYELVVFGNASDDLDYAIIKTYEIIEGFSFDELYYRTYEDFICKEYTGNILERIEAIESLIKSPQSEEFE